MGLRGATPTPPLALLLPLLAGGGWEGVKLLIFNGEEQPLPNPPLQAGEGAVKFEVAYVGWGER